MSSGRGLPAPRGTGWVLLVAGALGLLASGVLAVEKYLLLTNPFYAPSCELGGVVSCQAVMESWQSSLLGFPNPYLGLAGFSVVVTVGVVVLAGARLPRWFWAGLLTGTLAGFGLVLWLVWQSLVVISAVCPYCMVVWLVTTVLVVQVARVVLTTRTA